MRIANKKIRYILLVAIVLFAALGAGVAYQIRGEGKMEFIDKERYGSDPFEKFEHLAELKPYTFASQISSYDRIGGNNDGWGEGNFLYTDANGEKVMMDVKGPGVVNRLWFAGAWDFNQTYLNFYFDGENEPRIRLTMAELFAGNTPPFLRELVGDGSVSSGGNYSYASIQFSKSLKITTNAVGKDFFYHVGYELYRPDAKIDSWPEGDVNARMAELIKHTGTAPVANKDGKLESGHLNLPAGESRTLASLDGPRVITSVKLRIPEIADLEAGKEVLNGLRLQIRWDGEETPSVDAPLSSLFGMGAFGTAYVSALPAGTDDKLGLYLYFPMPYRKHADISLVSTREKTTKDIGYEISSSAFSGDMNGIGYFRTTYTELSPRAGDGSDYIVLDVQGTGHLVGIVQSFSGDLERRYLEGDERIYVDGSRTPAWIGTGTEDLYGGGGYFINGPFTLPFHGNPNHVINETDNTSAYRFLVNDPIPFRTRIKVGLEHGSDLNWDNMLATGTNNSNVDVATLAFYYYIPETSMHMTDKLDVGDPASEKQHGYRVDAETWSGDLTATYEGNEEDVVIRDVGRKHKGFSEFKLTVDELNKGVVLRRSFDQSEANQEAIVSVDGQIVGTWYRAGSNPVHAWRDDDFIIPSAYTSGKTEILIRLENASANSEWSEFKYEAYSIGFPNKSWKERAISLFGNDRAVKLPKREEQTPVNQAALLFGDLSEGWSWIREDRSHYRFSEDGTSVTIDGQPGELFDDTNSAINILLHEAPDADFSVSAKLSLPKHPDDNFQQAGLILYGDDDHYVKLGRSFSGANVFDFSQEIDKVLSGQQLPDQVQDKDVYLRITRIGNRLSAFYSTNGIKYTRVGAPIETPLTGLKIGLFSWTGSGPSLEATFSELKVTQH